MAPSQACLSCYTSFILFLFNLVFPKQKYREVDKVAFTNQTGSTGKQWKSDPILSARPIAKTCHEPFFSGWAKTLTARALTALDITLLTSAYERFLLLKKRAFFPSSVARRLVPRTPEHFTQLGETSRSLHFLITSWIFYNCFLSGSLFSLCSSNTNNPCWEVGCPRILKAHSYNGGADLVLAH